MRPSCATATRSARRPTASRNSGAPSSSNTAGSARSWAATADFWTLTAQALDCAAAACGGLEPELRRNCWPPMRSSTPTPTPALTARGSCAGAAAKTAILSNGSTAMLASAVAAAGLDGCLDARPVGRGHSASSRRIRAPMTLVGARFDVRSPDDVRLRVVEPLGRGRRRRFRVPDGLAQPPALARRIPTTSRRTGLIACLDDARRGLIEARLLEGSHGRPGLHGQRVRARAPSCARPCGTRSVVFLVGRMDAVVVEREADHQRVHLQVLLERRRRSGSSRRSRQHRLLAPFGLQRAPGPGQRLGR